MSANIDDISKEEQNIDTTINNINNNKNKQYLKKALNGINGLVRVSSFKQQKLPAWRPILTLHTVVPTFVLTSVALLIFGAGFLYLSYSVQVFSLDYTYCMPLHGSKTCAQILSDWRESFNASWPPPPCTCWYKFQLEEHFHRDVYLYYELSNYFQNHLHYIRSKDLSQFRGKASASDNCSPFRLKPVVVNGNRTKRPIVPCGTIANSLFNDTFVFWLVESDHHISDEPIVEVPLLRTGIAWQVDNIRFKNPPNRSTFRNFTNPPYWGNRTVWDLDPQHPSNNGLRNEALIVWMRVAAFPDFWKLYARVNHHQSTRFTEVIPSGQYYLKINYNYPVSSFKGRKSFILANTNKILGGSYFFLAILYLIVGVLCAIGAVALTIIHSKMAISKEECFNINESTPYLMS